MTSGRRPLNPEQANELWKGFTTQMIHSLPPAWDQLFLSFRAMGSYVELTAQIITVAGGSMNWAPPDSVLPFLMKMRDGMYDFDKGTAWISLRYHLVHPSRYTVEYNWGDREPDWNHVPPPEFFEQELEMYPRDEDELPEWFERRLDAGAT
jgi:hypothetical protein